MERLERVAGHVAEAPKAATNHRQAKYEAAERFSGPQVFPYPSATRDVEQAKRDLSVHGVCIVADAMSPDLLARVRAKLDKQSEAEARAFPHEIRPGKNIVGALQNKGAVFLELLEHPLVDELMGYLFGPNFLLHSLGGSYFTAPETEPQALHRDQGWAPSTLDFPAASFMFWLLDDFTPENGGTNIVPGSHRWPAECMVKPPPRAAASPVTAKAGSVVCWDGRVWHGTGANMTGDARRSISTFWCLPWIRQQDNWALSTLQEVIDGASDKLKGRLGLYAYGTLGMVHAAAPIRQGEEDRLSTSRYENKDDPSSNLRGKGLIRIPDAIVGEDAVLHPMRRVSREHTGRA